MVSARIKRRELLPALLLAALVQLELETGLGSQDQVAKVGWVKGAAKYADIHGDFHRWIHAVSPSCGSSWIFNPAIPIRIQRS